MRSIPDLPPLLARADADARRGTGHVMRCLALAQAWRARGGAAVFISRCDSATLRERILSTGAELISLAPGDSVEADIENTLAQLSRREAAWLALDGYDFSLAQQQTLRGAGHPLLVIDDIAHLDRYCADILLNQNLGAAALSYRCDPQTTRLFGPHYALLRPEFAHWRRGFRGVPEVARKILVTLGGSDPNNFTARVIGALAQLDTPGLEVRVVVGPANPHLPELRERADTLAPQIQLLSRVYDMAELMAWADLAVSAAGTTCWELACLGLPALIVIMAENQRRSAEELDALEVAQNLGWHEAVSVERLAAAVPVLQHDSLRRLRMSEQGRTLVDGRGAERVAQALFEDSRRRAA
ncbi:MAG: UDP-2,4-diacetamido-2,4,6-trideoxy-beta-L-altropyranose hydrolase [Deltaproteobacteria bacterium]|nr:UDP-2,4-diacetamido-2,4,6-trideoxy-beta-L-altropyranose hydrolase [Deltaproteobacteria bacterium]